MVFGIKSFEKLNSHSENSYISNKSYNSHNNNTKYHSDGYYQDYDYCYKSGKCSGYVLVGESILMINLSVLIIKCVYLIFLVVLK